MLDVALEYVRRALPLVVLIENVDQPSVVASISALVGPIATHSWSRGLAPRCPEGVVLQDADRLDALGVVGLMRNVAVAEAMSRAAEDGSTRAFAHPVDPLFHSDRPLDDRHFAIDHWFEKLLLLCDGMHLPSARAEARRRHQWMQVALAQLSDELGGTGAPLNAGGTRPGED